MAAAVNMTNLPLWLSGASYPADLDRTLLGTAFQAGVANIGDLRVFQRHDTAGGPNLSVDVQGGVGFVPAGDPVGTWGYLVRADDEETNVPVDPAPGANARIDIIVAEVIDPTSGGTGANGWRLRAVNGTVAAAPVVPDTPPNCLKLAEVRRNAGDATVTDARITDVRGPMAYLTPQIGGMFLPKPAAGSMGVDVSSGEVFRAMPDQTWRNLRAGMLESADMTGNHYGGAPPADDSTRWKVAAGRQTVAMFGGAGTIKLPYVFAGIVAAVFTAVSNTQGVVVTRRTTGTPNVGEIHGTETWFPITGYSTTGTARSGVNDTIDYVVIGWV